MAAWEIHGAGRGDGPPSCSLTSSCRDVVRVEKADGERGGFSSASRVQHMAPKMENGAAAWRVDCQVARLRGAWVFLAIDMITQVGGR